MPTWESNFRAAAAASAVGKPVHILKVVEYSVLASNVDWILIGMNLDLLRNSIAIWFSTGISTLIILEFLKNLSTGIRLELF